MKANKSCFAIFPKTTRKIRNFLLMLQKKYAGVKLNLTGIRKIQLKTDTAWNRPKELWENCRRCEYDLDSERDTCIPCGKPEG